MAVARAPEARRRSGSRLGQREIDRLLSTPGSDELFGVRVAGSPYTRNGLRLLGISATASTDTVRRATADFRTAYKFDPAMALEASVPTGYDQSCPVDDAIDVVNRLDDPRRRVVAELFWLGVPEAQVARLVAARSMQAPEVFTELEQTAKGGNGREALAATHALAIICHNQAIAEEVAFALGHGEWPQLAWTRALRAWSAVLQAEAFWAAFRSRLAAADDPRLKPEAVDELRERAPGVILSTNVLFAQAYETAGHDDLCRQHLSLVGGSKLPLGGVRRTLVSIARKVAGRRVEALGRQVREKLVDGKRRRRAEFTKAAEKYFTEADSILSGLSDGLGLPSDVVGEAELDPFCQAMLDAVNQGLDYKTDDRLCTVLYSLLQARRLATYPVSPATRRTLNDSASSDARVMYDGLAPAGSAPDPTDCFFMPGETADPDHSVLLPVYKITSRQVEVDRARMAYGVRVFYSQRQVLVPRSALAASCHAGLGPDQLLAKLAPPGDDGLWVPCDRLPAGVVPWDGKPLVEWIEAIATQRAAVATALEDGTLASWLRGLGQRRLAEQVEQLVGTPEALASLRSLLLPAAAAQAMDLRRHRRHIVERRAAALRAKLARAIAKERQKLEALLAEHERDTAEQARADGQREATVRAAWAAAAAEARASEEAAQREVAEQASAALAELPGAGGVGALTAAWRRWRIRTQSRRQSRQLAAGLAAELAELEASALADLAPELSRKAERKAARSALEAETKRQVAECEARAEAVLVEGEQKLLNESAGALKRLRDCLKTRPLSDTHSFPVYREAVGQGFRAGEKPSAQEFEMTYSERQEGQRRLLGGLY